MVKVKVKRNSQMPFEVFEYNIDRVLVSDVLKKEGIQMETPCGCIGTCGKCIVRARGDLSDPTERELASGLIESGKRLSCTTYIHGEAVIELDDREQTLSFSDESPDAYIDLSHCGNDLVISFDIGTTGISAELLDVDSQRLVRRVSVLNPQTAYGNDVLSRICYAAESETGTSELQKVINDCIHGIILKLSEDINPQSVKKVYIAGNTTMLHLISGENPNTIAKAPYTPVFLESRQVVLEKSLSDEVPYEMTLLPSASSYIGADIVAGLYAQNLHDHSVANLKCKSESVLFIDIGTNGEMVMTTEQKHVATSTAAGPALEGMNIECGMRAVEGAIDSLSIDPYGHIEYTTIGGAPAKGICGSGLIDVMAQLVVSDIVLKNGRFNKNMDCAFADRWRDKRFYITDDVYVSQKDIRQIQLAKGAIATGIKMLYKEAQKDMQSCVKILIAGSFGYHLSEESIRGIGLIPEEMKCLVDFVGNTSLAGASRAALSSFGLESLENISKSIEVLELSRSDSFQDVFVSELGF